MSQITIATWNVNSLRVRLPQLGTWVAESKPDVIALQETKLPDPDSPAAEIDAIGNQCAYSRQRTSNGVAVLSRQTIEVPATGHTQRDDEHKRVHDVRTAGPLCATLHLSNGPEP